MPALSKVVTDVSEAMSIKFNTLVYDLKRSGKDITVLSLGEAYFDIPLFGFDNLPFPDLYHYSHSRGIPELRKQLAEYFGSEYGVPVDPETEILITAGSKAAIYMTLMTLLDPGSEVLVPEPAWVSYTEQIRLCYGVPVGIPVGVPPEDYEKYVTPRTRALIINTPHNPTGYVYSRNELDCLLEMAERHNMWILSDEAYSDFVLDEPFTSLGNRDPEKRRSVVFNSLSKNSGISGWRLGYVVANSELIYNVLKVNQHLITCPATILEYYVAENFRRILEVTLPQIRELLELRRRLAAFMDEIGLRYLPGTATFFFFVSIVPSRLTSEDFATRLLEEHHVSTVPGLGYGNSCDGYIRVSIGTADEEQIRRALRRVSDMIKDTSGGEAALD
jgi:aspartate aminotransferase/aminotransferase